LSDLSLTSALLFLSVNRIMLAKPHLSPADQPIGLRRFFEIESGWLAILGLIGFSVLLLVAGAGKVLTIAFPLAALLVGLFLYRQSPVLYVGYSFWLWFLAPLVRRLADFRGEFTDPSAVLLAPNLVSLVTLITLFRWLPRSTAGVGGQFILTISSILYGICIGLLSRPGPRLLTESLVWLSPIVFGFHLYVSWRDYPIYRQNFQRVFVWGALLMGAYGIFQYFTAPAWDMQWLKNIELVSMGQPEPQGFRIWSSMNSTEPFSALMATILILLLTVKSPLIIPASIVGYISLLLTLARSSWLGWLAGIISLAGALRPKFQIRLLATILVMALCVVPLATMEPFNQVIGDRLATFSNLEDDQSAQDRQGSYSGLLGEATSNIMGNGIGGPRYDSAVLSFLFDLGWIGTVMYMFGMLAMTVTFFRHKESSSDMFLAALKAILISTYIKFPLNTPMIGASGVVLWSALGLGMAAIKYHHHNLQQSSAVPTSQVSQNI
jgi:hypothetical protein